eukprot:Em0005g1433a
MDTVIPHDLNLKAVLRSFPKLTSVGPSGLRIQHIIDASEVPLQTPIFQSLRAIINLLAAGSAPSEVSTFLAGGSLTALNKSKPGSLLDIRPIAVDMKNNFNMVSQEAILSECSKHFPELLPWATWCYSQHLILWHPLGSLHSEQGVQQCDSLGPLLFSLVLNKVVSEITANSVCADLSYHAWYLDDGVLAGPRPAVLQALSSIQEIGPPNGLIVNFHKCEIFSKHDVSPFPPEMKRSTHPNCVILGIPIGDRAFCSTFISEKHEEAKALLLKLEEVSAVDPHVAFSLLRQCAGFCKLAHLARGTPPSQAISALEAFDHNIRATFSKCTVVDTSNQAWQQAELSLSRGGLGICSLSRHSSAAYIASLSSSGAVPLSQEHLIHAVELFNSLVPSSDAVSMEEVLTSRIHQKVLSNKIDNHLFNILYGQSSTTDRARLLSVSSPHAAAWVSVIPLEGLGLHLKPSEFQVAITWWLGLDTSCCPLCPGRVLDLLGHHALTCKRGGDVVTRHNKLRDTLAETCRRAHLSVKLEAGSNLTKDHSHTRPADILVPNWSWGKLAAFDLSVTSPLNSNVLLEAGHNIHQAPYASTTICLNHHADANPP